MKLYYTPPNPTGNNYHKWRFWSEFVPDGHILGPRNSICFCLEVGRKRVKRKKLTIRDLGNGRVYPDTAGKYRA